MSDEVILKDFMIVLLLLLLQRRGGGGVMYLCYCYLMPVCDAVNHLEAASAAIVAEYWSREEVGQAVLRAWRIPTA